LIGVEKQNLDLRFVYILLEFYMYIIHNLHLISYTLLYLLRKYQLNANCCISAGNGVGTSVNPGRATGCLKYTAEQILGLTSKYRGIKAKALI
jgi:hypothetical protein